MLSPTDLENLRNVAKTRGDTRLNRVINEYERLRALNNTCEQENAALKRERIQWQDRITKLQGALSHVRGLLERKSKFDPMN